MVMSHAPLAAAGVDRPAAVGVGSGLEGAAEQARALGHADQAIAGRRVPGGARVAVVAHGQTHLAVFVDDGTTT